MFNTIAHNVSLSKNPLPKSNFDVMGKPDAHFQQTESGNQTPPVSGCQRTGQSTLLHYQDQSILPSSLVKATPDACFVK